ncbi:reverse transcriptase domain-containing protein [Tanacetum coccineum]
MLIEVGKFIFLADFVILEMEKDNKVPLILGRLFLHTADVVIRVKHKQLNLKVRTERMIFQIDSAMKHSYLNDDTCFSIDVIDEILEDGFDALFEEGSEILHSIEGTILEEKLFAEFDEFMAMTADENSKSKSDTEEPPFEKNHLQHNPFLIEDMDQDSAHMFPASKVPMLKLGEFELSRMRIEQYIQMIYYALWEVIENGNSAPKTIVVEGVEKLKFNSIKDAKLLLEAIEKRFGGNAATKKTQRNLLKQQYENFTAPSLEILDQTFDRL